MTLATRGRAANYVGSGDQPPASAKLWFRRRLDLDACSVDVKTDDEGLTRVLAPRHWTRRPLILRCWRSTLMRGLGTGRPHMSRWTISSI